MTKEAVVVLLDWATKQPKSVQQKFSEFYNEYRIAYTFSETSSGVFSNDKFEKSRLILAEGMRQMISEFEARENYINK